MTEKEFLTLYKERRNLKSIREAKERLDSFWKALFDVLEEEEKVTIKDWGIFEKKEINDQILAIYKEGAALGYDVRILRKIVSIRKKDINDLREEDLIEAYKESLGMV